MSDRLNSGAKVKVTAVIIDTAANTGAKFIFGSLKCFLILSLTTFSSSVGLNLFGV